MIVCLKFKVVQTFDYTETGIHETRDGDNVQAVFCRCFSGNTLVSELKTTRTNKQKPKYKQTKQNKQTNKQPIKLQVSSLSLVYLKSENVWFQIILAIERKTGSLFTLELQ